MHPEREDAIMAQQNDTDRNQGGSKQSDQQSDQKKGGQQGGQNNDRNQDKNNQER